MKVLFISPHYPPEMEDFTRGLAEIGAEVYAVADVPESQLPGNVRRCLSGYLQVPGNYAPEEKIISLIMPWVANRGIERVESLWEPLQLLAARVREKLGLPGMSHDTVLGFRDKDIMKQRVRAAGLRVPKSERVRSAKDIFAACERIGFPAIVKPIDGAGSADTYRLNDANDIKRVLPLLGHIKEGNVEEYIEGEEFTFDAVSIDGIPVFHSVNQYHPTMLVSRSLEWVSPADITFRDPDIPKLAGGVQLGKDVLKALNMGTGFSHMEWFLTPKGEAVFGEIACRNGGGHLVDLMNYCNDFDIYREWARCVCFDEYEGRPARKYHSSMICKRAQGQGTIRYIDGLDRVRRRLGDSLVLENLNPVGSPRRDWLKSIVSDGFIVLRHEDYDECHAMMQFVVSELKMFAG